MDNPEDKITENFIINLLSEMTPQEKISQMIFDAPAVDRLDIKKYNWWNECLHGLGRAGVATVFPQSIGLAASWNPELMNQIATAISDEARAKHHEAKRHGNHAMYAGLTFWSPTINIFRDPRWGRGQETYGEDPYLTATMGVAFVKGLQGDNPRFLKVVATPKHYAVHGGPESSRHHYDAKIDEWALREFYLFAFEACVKEAKAASIMGAYNRVNGEPCCASHTLLTKILRQEWGFDGYVVSDCEAIRDIFENHKVTSSATEAAALAVRNGCDLNCGTVYSALRRALRQGLISEDELNRSVERLMTARTRLGMFMPDHEVDYAQIPYDVIDSLEHRNLALESARESIVLLKNEGNLLPLDKELRSIAVIGPNAHKILPLLGNYSGTPRMPVTVLDGISGKVSASTRVDFSQGCEITKGILPLKVIPSAHLLPSDSVQETGGLSASYFDNPSFEGDPAISKVDPEIDFIWKDTTPLSGQWGDSFSVIWDGFLVPPTGGTYNIGVKGHNDFRLLLDGKSIIKHGDIHHPILKTIEVDLEAGEVYSIRLEYINVGLDPQIQLLWSLLDVDYKQAALTVARRADVVIAVMGLSPELEGEEMPVNIEGFSGGDRTDILLPGAQEELLKEIHALGKPVILVLLNGSALAINWAAENVPVILEAWYPGQEGGDAIADVIFGDFNPAGKLPVTFYKSVDDLPPFEDYGLEHRTYRYLRKDPLYPFGFGLSYSTFDLDNFHIDREVIAAGQTFNISATVENVGEHAGAEVVQLYIRHPKADTPRPIKVLIGFRRVPLDPGQRRRITFKLSANQLGFYNRNADYILPAGSYHIYLGTSSADLLFQARIRVQETKSIHDTEKVFCSESSIG